MIGPFRWVVVVEVDVDVAVDGLDTLTDARVEQIFHKGFPFARGEGLRARVVAGPAPGEVEKMIATFEAIAAALRVAS